MSTTLDINAIRDYLLKVGCKIEYPILVNAFKQHLYNPDPNVQGKIRTQFKDYVNRLAIVSLENNMKFIILRPEFRPKENQPKVMPKHDQQVMSSSTPTKTPPKTVAALADKYQHQQQLPPPPPPPRPPPRRRQSTASLFKPSPQTLLQPLTTRSRSLHREDESDSSSLQSIDPLRRKWVIEACNRNYNGLINLIRENPKLASYKDIVCGYTALHWAAKFNNLDIIKLIAGTYSVSVNIKSSAGHTPLHVAFIFNQKEAADLLIRKYKADPNIRDHTGKRPTQYRKI